MSLPFWLSCRNDRAASRGSGESCHRAGRPAQEGPGRVLLGRKHVLALEPREQATPETVAAYRAARRVGLRLVFDLGGGAGFRSRLFQPAGWQSRIRESLSPR
jgi:hypothetical protein